MRAIRLNRLAAMFLCLGIAGLAGLPAGPVEAMASEAEAMNQQEFSVTLKEEYPKVGETLHAEVQGLEEYETCTFTWKADQKIVGYGETYRPTTDDLEKFITVSVTTSQGISREQSVYLSKLPVVYIDTNNVPVLDKENYVKGSMLIQGNDKFNLNNTTLYDGDLEIRGRGNSSWDAPKKPYRIKLGTKADIFGMGANKHWTLLANYYDPSLSRNELSYDFSGELGLAFMDSENVVLIMNGQYQGVYQLCEHIRIDKTRINITDWEKVAEDTAEVISEAEGLDTGDLEDYLVEHMTWTTSKEFDFNGRTYDLADYEVQLPEIDGGYLLELDKNLDEVSSFYTSHNQPLMFKSPEYVKTNKEMMQYVKDYINAFEAAIDSPDGYTMYQGEEVHYSELYDMDALVQYFLVTELFFNTDGMKKSTYLYKGNGEPMKMGPIWDMDWCAGSPYEQSSPWNRWQTMFYDDEMVSEQWYRSLIGDPYFAYKVKHLYDTCRASIEAFVSEGGRIDRNVEYLREAGIKNDAKWNAKTTGFLKSSENLKKWMAQRISWLDGHMESVDSLLQSWETFQSNQENDSVISIKEIASMEEGIRVSIDTNSSEKIGVYINGMKYAESIPENKALEVLIPYEEFGEAEAQEVFVVVRTKAQGKICTAYQEAEIELPEDKPEPPVNITEVFSDVKDGEWYAEAVQYVYNKGIMNGSGGLFKPNGNITREQVAATLYNLEGAPKVTDYTAVGALKDVKAGQWYTDAVCWAYNAGVATGNSSTKMFNIGKSITRQQLAMMLYNYAEYKGFDTETRGDYSELKGANEVESYAAEAMKWAYGTGLISGSKSIVNGTAVYDLKPAGTATRAQMASILKNFCEGIKDDKDK